ncbi:MAG: cytochrome c biogenesis protein ResB [Bdellovibrionia bacterium]
MSKGGNFKVFEKIFQVLCSLKLAVLVILSIAISLAAGTIVESLHDTATSQYWVYRSPWFYGILSVFGMNIFCVAISRLPWKRRHIPFLTAHLGILTLLAGSWITQRAGVDGNLRVSEGEVASVVELDTASLFFSEADRVHAMPIPWIPTDVKFKPISASQHGLPFEVTVDQYLTHADPIISFISNISKEQRKDQGKPDHGIVASKQSSAVRLHLVGGPMGISQDIWLWQGDPNWSNFQAGPAWFSIDGKSKGGPHQPSLAFQVLKDGSLSYVAKSSSGTNVKGLFREGKIAGSLIHPGWKGNMVITLSEWIPDAVPQTTYQASRIQSGSQAPTSAIHLAVPDGGAEVWLGLGDRAVLHINGKEVLIGYLPKRIVLPFGIRLERFTVDHDQGTLTPAAYSSRVSVLDGKIPREANISMNEPLELGGYTVYQASYENGDPRPTTSIFAVNRDPGRPWKYTGSLLIVLGSVLLFASRVRQGKRVTKKAYSADTELNLKLASAQES